MTICNMAIEGGGKSGIIAPDETTFEYVRERRFAPKGEEFDKKWLNGKNCIQTL